MKDYIVSLDQGTTSSRAIVFDRAGRVVSSAQYDFPQIYPKLGWVEQDAEVLLDSQLRAVREAVASAGLTADRIAAIGITNQRETVVVWDAKTGRPVCNAVVWQCRRTAELCESLKERGLAEYIRGVTGLPIDAYFSGTKIKWILDRQPDGVQRAAAGELLAGTVDSWLIWKLTGGKRHITDISNASRTMLFDIVRQEYSEKLCELLGIPMAMLPEVVPNSGYYGTVETPLLPELRGVPICSAIGDQQAALFGQGCFSPGDTKNTYGTGCFTLMNIGDRPVVSERLITTVGWKIGNDTVYAAEGSVFNAGSSIKWLIDGLGIIDRPSECDRLAETIPDNGGVYFVSAFTGLGAPHWDMYARGLLCGLTRGTGKAHICRAVLEGIAYQVTDLVRAMEREFGCPITGIRVDGGASVSDFMMQFQSDLLGIEVRRPPEPEITAFGAACFAGLAVGFWNSLDEISQMITEKGYHSFTPQRPIGETRRLYEEWQSAVRRTLCGAGDPPR